MRRSAFLLSLLLFLAAAPSLAHTLVGYVTSGDGAPLADAKVSLLDDRRNTVDWVVTDANGYYRIRRILSGSYDLVVEKPGYQRYQRRIDLLGYSVREFRHDVTLQPRASTMAQANADLDRFYLPVGTKISRKALKLLAKGEKLESAGELNRALEYFEKARKIEPTFARIPNAIGIVQQKLGLLEQALASFQEACKLNPRDPIPRINLGGLLNHLKRPEEALPLLEKALAVDPTLAKAHYYYGVALYNVGRYKDAIAPLQQALQIEPAAHVSGWALLGNIQVKLGDYREAIRFYRKFIELDPHHPEADRVRETIAKLEAELTRPLGN
jgi:tetratricopeptide (TPR) repeat protein